MFAHASILSLRIKKPELPRPFKLRLNLKIMQRELPISAIIGLVATSTVWIIIISTQPYSRWVGIAWIMVGLIIYLLLRRKHQLPLTNQNSEESTRQNF
jgi:APA family basic amino acid/polyamine antiporter